MWNALWVTLPNETTPRFGGWLWLTAEQVMILHAWIRHDPWPCVYKLAESGFTEIKLYDIAGNITWHTPACPPGLVA